MLPTFLAYMVAVACIATDIPFLYYLLETNWIPSRFEIKENIFLTGIFMAVNDLNNLIYIS